MPRSKQVQSSFTAGELSPRAFGRTDLARYKNGLKTLQNWLPSRLGGIQRRSGFRFVKEVKDSSKATRLIPFEFNALQTYVLEFGAKDSASSTIGTADTSTNAFTIDGADNRATFPSSRTFTVSGSTGNDGTYTVLNVEYDGTDTLVYVDAIADNTADGTIVADIGYVRFYRDEGQLESATDVATEIDSPYDADDLDNIKFAQSNDVLFLAHPDYEPRKLTRTAGADNLDATWSISLQTHDDGPYLPRNTTAVTATPAATTGGTFGTPIVVTFSADTAINGGAGFTFLDIGRQIRIIDAAGGNAGGWATIVSITTNVVVGVIIGGDFASTTSRTTWSLGSWWVNGGYPSVVSIFKERLFWASTFSEPATFFASVLNDFDTHSPTSLTNDGTNSFNGIVLQISDDQLNTIRWLVTDKRGLLVLTDGGVFNFTNNAAGEPIGPISPTSSTPGFGFDIDRQNADTVSPLVRPHRAGKLVLMLEKGDRRLLQEQFTFVDDRTIGSDLTILANHILVGGSVASAFQNRPEQRLWIARSDGVLCSMTFDTENEIVAWARHKVGGSLSGEDQAKVESIVAIREENEDQLWAVVQRSINGQQKRYVEFMEELFDFNDESEDAFIVDSGLTLNDSKTITAIANSNPVMVTAVAHGFSDADTVRIREVKGFTKTVTDDDNVDSTVGLNNRSFTIGGVETDTFTLLNEDGTPYSAYSSAGVVNQEVTVISGLTHLEGETVVIWGDGARYPDTVVSGGQITLNKAASKVQIGLSVVSLVTTMPITATTEGVDSRGGVIQIGQVFLVVDRSLGGMIGREDGEYNELIYRQVADAMGEGLPLFTGYLEIEY